MTEDSTYPRREPTTRACSICGSPDRLANALIYYAGDDKPYGYGPRCIDRGGCRTRTNENGDKYPEDGR